MRQVLEDRKTLRDHFVRLAAFDVRDEAETAGVVLVSGVVQALGCGGIARMRGLIHAGPRFREQAAAPLPVKRHKVRRNPAKPVNTTRDAALRQESGANSRRRAQCNRAAFSRQVCSGNACVMDTVAL